MNDQPLKGHVASVTGAVDGIYYFTSEAEA